MDYHQHGMRTTPSRFAAFTGTVGLPTQRPQTLRPATLGPLHAPSPGSALEGYPAVVRALTLLWGRPEMNQYFDKVWSGQDPTLNLDPDALADLMLLAGVHRHICPYRPAQPVDAVYGRTADRWLPMRPRG
jgi:hypothetical protein